MTKFTTTTAVLLLSPGAAMAEGLDRSYTPIDIIFQDGNYAEVSVGYVDPSLDGVDLLGNAVANVGEDFTVLGRRREARLRRQIRLCPHPGRALRRRHPVGRQRDWNASGRHLRRGGVNWGADGAEKYQATDRFSVYGGGRAVRADGEIGLSGLAYGTLNGYEANFRSDYGAGAVLGAAYEIPDIAFRTALTWHSSIDLDMNTAEAFPTAPGVTGPFVPTGVTPVELPQSVKLAAQSGIARDTLLFGSVRWSEWEAFSLDPPSPAPNLAELDDAFTYEIGIGRRFTDKLSARVSYIYEAGGSDSLVSPLAPTNGQQAVTLGGKYRINDTFDISGGVRYTMLGNALPETGTPDTPRGLFKNNDAVSVGLKLGAHF